MMRVVALFGLYVFYSTQPTSRAPRLYSREHVPVPLGAFILPSFSQPRCQPTSQMSTRLCSVFQTR
jgi:hypothetical protein